MTGVAAIVIARSAGEVTPDASVVLLAFRSPSIKYDRSRPEEKFPPAPLMTIVRTSALLSSSVTCVARSLHICTVKAFFRAGFERVRVATSPSSCVITPAVAALTVIGSFLPTRPWDVFPYRHPRHLPDFLIPVSIFMQHRHGAAAQ